MFCKQKWGEAVIAYVELRGGQTRDAAGLDAALMAFAREALGAVKAPKAIHVIETLPRTNAGKVSRAELRKPFWANAGKAI